MYLFNEKKYKCSLEASIHVLAGKWRSLILWHLMDNKLRFSHVQKIVPGISKKVLSEHLRVLEKNKLIIRTVYATVPPSVDYEISQKGKSLVDILNQLEAWGKDNLYVKDELSKV